jgi:DNA repair exonuclease SbcCD ATPase subunit
MEITLDGISISNFKGIKRLEVMLGGRSAIVSAMNEGGKSSIVDSFMWVFFDKDSENKANFDIQPNDENGNPIHNVTVDVQVALFVDGSRRTFRKTYAEKWTTKRGNDTAELTGHDIGYFVDGISVPKAKYQVLVSEIIPETEFRIYTNPRYINVDMDWKTRRSMLMALGAFKPDHELAAENKEFAALSESLQRFTLDDIKKSKQGQLNKTNDEIEAIPHRIDENTRLLSSFSEMVHDTAYYDSEIARLNEELGAVEKQIKEDQNNLDEYAILLKRRMAAQQNLANVEEKIRRESTKEVDEAKIEAQRYEMQVRHTEGLIDSLKETAKANEQAAVELEKTRTDLLSKLKSAKSKEFSASDPRCPSCGQVLPEDMQREAFEKAKAKAIDEIMSEGLKVKLSLEKTRGNIDSSNDMLYKNQMDLKELRAKCQNAVDRSKAPVDAVNYEKHEEWAAAVSELKRLEAVAEPDSSMISLTARRSELNAEICKNDDERHKIEQAQKTKDRIAELETQKEEQQREALKLKKEINTIEKFITYKCRLCEDSINKMFTGLKWRLFERQINGGVNEVCECLIKGVPYRSANNAARINVGLEIIDVFSKNAGISVPIFVDNAESVNRDKFYKTDAQLIKLVVSEDPLKVEVLE